MWPSVAAEAWTSQWPQVTEKATHMLVQSSSNSNAQTVPLLFLSHLSFTHLHIVVASAAGGPPRWWTSGDLLCLCQVLWWQAGLWVTTV